MGVSHLFMLISHWKKLKSPLFINLYEVQCAKMSWSNIKKRKGPKKKLAKLSSSQCTVGNVGGKISKMAIDTKKWPFFSLLAKYIVSKHTLFLSSLKMEEKEVSFSLKLWFFSWDMATLSKNVKKRAIFDQKMAILWPNLEFAWACPWFNQVEILPK